MIPKNILFLPPPSRQIVREIRRVNKHNKRAKEAGFVATLTVNEWLAILHRSGWRCVFCSGVFQCIEHKVRLADGGATDAQNCVPCCTDCNSLRNRFQSDLAELERWAMVGAGVVVADLVKQMVELVGGY